MKHIIGSPTYFYDGHVRTAAMKYQCFLYESDLLSPHFFSVIFRFLDFVSIKNKNAEVTNNWEKVNVGSLIAVYWDEFKCYYACEVLKKKGTKFQIKYEDNSTEWRVLSKSVFRWQEDEPPTDDESSEGEEDEETSDDEDTPKSKKNKCKFVVDEAVEVNGNEEDDEEASECDD